MADYDVRRQVPISSTEPVEIALKDQDGNAVNLTDAYLVAVHALRSQDAGTAKTYNQTATGADDTANTPRVFIVGDPANGVVQFIPPAAWRNTGGGIISYWVWVYEDATVYLPYPQDRPMREEVIADAAA